MLLQVSLMLIVTRYLLVVFTGQVATPGIGKDAFKKLDLLSMTTPITNKIIKSKC